VSLSEDRLEEFSECVERAAAAALSPADLVPVIEVDDLVSLAECTGELVNLMKKLRPFGAGNPEPIFGTRDVKLVAAKAVGNGHLKLTVAQGDRLMDAIGFGMADSLGELRECGGMIALAYVLEENAWRGVTELQLRIKDVQPEEY
jgi:single-stranded-DNA-specific exonuclease